MRMTRGQRVRLVSTMMAARRGMTLALALGLLSPAFPARRGGWGVEAAEQAQPVAASADELLVVDCLLPGQVRRLGSRMNFLTARRAVKTTARDCEIRGGEYTAYDRATYQTALKVWESLAHGGDAAAQTYVGEIYEKGLGVPPNYAAAAQWYRRAAEQGFSRAAINLGNLYEKGLGVPQDSQEALHWYRRAAGLGALSFQVAPTPAAAAELQRLQRENEELRRALSAKQAEQDRMQRELESLRRTLDQRRGEADSERAEIARLRKDLEAARGKEQSTASAALRDLERAVAEREARLAAKDRELAEVRAALDRRSKGPEGGGADRDRELADLRAALARREAEAGELARLRKELEASRSKEQGASATLRDLERAVAEREASLAAKDRELAEVRAALAQREKDAADRRAELDQLRLQAASTGPNIEVIQPELVAAEKRDIGVAGPSRALVDAVDRVVLVGRVTAVGGLKALTINGREEALDRDDMFKTQVPLKRSGERVQIVAIDRGGRKSTVEFLVVDRSAPSPVDGDGVGFRPTKKALQFGTYHALVIGNNGYKHLRPLQTAVNDAKEVGRILEREYGFKVTLLLNATRYDILSALNKLREQLTEKDNLLIYYAGHGELDQVNQRGHWLPVDAEPNSSANWISNVSITDIFNAMSVRQLLVVADSCYSGTMTRSSLAQLEAGLSEEKRLELMEFMAQKRSRMVMSSGGVEPVLDTAGGSHSVFAQSFIELLQKNGGVLPGQEMFRLLRLRVAGAARTMDMSQVPEYAPIKFAGHESGDFFFLRLASN